jgi:hypothetical protein
MLDITLCLICIPSVLGVVSDPVFRPMIVIILTVIFSTLLLDMSIVFVVIDIWKMDQVSSDA